MKELALNENGLPDRKFYRALTGNRRIQDGKICHVTDEWIDNVRDWYNSDEPAGPCPWDVQQSVEIMLQNNREFATTEKSLGFVPEYSQVGDSIAIFEGASVPLVIRKRNDTSPLREAWSLVGECYIEGLMEGEFVDRMASQQDFKGQNICIM
ncbi:hypothetical protein SCUP234_05041 [Seiridium cupressi]